MRGWLPKLAAIGTPLLDRARAAEALDMILSWCARQTPTVSGLMFPAVTANGPTVALIRARVHTYRLEIRPFDSHERAALFSADDVDPQKGMTITARKLRELRRQRRKLEEQGALTWTSASDPVAIRAAFEKFLTLEAQGWKGRRGTALLSNPADTTFGRAMTRLLARKGQCHIDALELDRRPIAMGITLKSGLKAALWKIAYDESHAACSPGVQFILDYTQRQITDKSITVTDSCAIPDHPMIDHIWPHRLAMADLFICVDADRFAAFATASNREQLRRSARAFIKRAWLATRSRKVPRPPATSPEPGGNHTC